MTIWKGWPERVVRQSGRPQVATKGLTAVNITSVQAGPMADTGRSSMERRCESRTPSPLVVSTCLRRNGDASMVTAAATNATRMYNVTTGSMKRVSESWNTIKPKRSKFSHDYDDNIEQKEASVESLLAKMPGSNMEILPQCIDLPLVIENSVTSDLECPERNTGLMAPIPVYAPNTTMNNLRHSTQVTSLDHFRSFTRTKNSNYLNPPRPNDQQVDAEFSRPWLNAVVASQGTTVLHSSQALVSNQLTSSANNEQQSAVAKSYIKQQPLRHDKSRTLATDKSVSEADLYSDDQFDEEAMFIADSIATKIESGTMYESPTRLSSMEHQITLHSPVSSMVPVYKENEQVASDSSEYGSDKYDLDEIQGDIAMRLMAQEQCQSDQKEIFPRARTAKQNIHEVDAGMHYDGALLSKSERQILGQRALGTPRDGFEPIARSPFPKSVPDRSPLFGVCNSAVLRTCFRIGEALNTGSQAVRQNKSVIIELYARVTQSWRENAPGRKQHFEFRDLYHDNPPALHGTFSLWDQLKSWDLDSVPFVRATERGIICRVIAIIRRSGEGWRLEVLRIWEASWDDIEHVSGIYKRVP